MHEPIVLPFGTFLRLVKVFSEDPKLPEYSDHKLGLESAIPAAEKSIAEFSRKV